MSFIDVYIKGKNEKVTDEEIKRRLSICSGCQHNIFNVCIQCYCPIVDKSKYMIED